MKMSVGQKRLFLMLLVLFKFTVESSDMYEDDTDSEPEAQYVLTRAEGKCGSDSGEIDCNCFHEYAMNCTSGAALIYNSVHRYPPMPSNILDWCKALKFQVNCAIDWNTHCAQLTENHYNEETIKGHLHVINNICEDNEFLLRYGVLHNCISSIDKDWEVCYSDFKTLCDEEKNKTTDWTHYETHFYLCCARGHFRLCTLETALNDDNSQCTDSESIVLQKFSVAISEGEVYQECDRHIMHANCPGGDPRPPPELIEKLFRKRLTRRMNSPDAEVSRTNSAIRSSLNDLLLLLMVTLIIIC